MTRLTDLLFQPGVVGSGVLTGGAIRPVSAVKIAQTYTQANQPTDTAIGSPLLIVWNATLNDTDSGVGPRAQTPLFGPRGAVNLEGTIQYGVNQAIFGLGPLGFADMLKVQNVVGANRNIRPGWGYESARLYVADTNTVTWLGNDYATGASAFVDSAVYATANGGTSTGTSYDIGSFVSGIYVTGNSTFRSRTAYEVQDINYYVGTPLYDLTPVLTTLIPGVTAGLGTVTTNYGLRIPNMVGGTKNVGVENASATVHPMKAVSITAAGNTLPLGASVLAVTATSALTLTSTPTIAAGLDGERIVILNVGTNALTLQDEAALASTGLLIAPDTGWVRLNQNESLTVRYSTSLGKWLKENRSAPFGDPLAAITGPAQFKVTDGTNSHGKVSAAVGVLGASVNVWGDATDSFVKSQLTGTGMSVGPGGGSATDFKILRTGTAAGAVTGTLTMTSPVINTPTNIVKGDVGLGNVENSTLLTATAWAAKGDLPVGTANDTAAVLTKGTDGQALTALAAETTGLIYANPRSGLDAFLCRTGALGETVSRATVSAAGTLGPLVSGTLQMSALYLPKSVVVTNIGFLSGATAAGTPTNWWYGLFDSARVAKRLTANQTTTAWAANTEKVLALTSTFTTTYEGLYYLGIMMTATTPISTIGVTGSSTLHGLAPILCGLSTTGCTTPVSEASTATAITTGLLRSYAYVT